MSVRRPSIGTTALAALAASAMLGAGAAMAASATQVRVVVSPMQPTSTTALSIGFDPLPGSGGPCLAWTLLRVVDHTLLVTGSVAPIGVCAVAHGIDVPPLPVGHYRVIAVPPGTDEPAGEAHFDVTDDPQAPANVFDVALDPAEPRAGQPFVVVLSIMNSECGGVLFTGPPAIVGDTLVFDGQFADCPVIPASFAIYGHRFVAPALPAGLKHIEIRNFGVKASTKSFHVATDVAQLSTWSGRFEAALHWRDRDGGEHDADARALTGESGLFWFFDDRNAEVTLKVLNGSAVNGQYWVFAASMTDLPFTLSVRDHACDGSFTSCIPERLYVQEAGKNRNFLDTNAFPSCNGCPPPPQPAAGRP